MFSLADRLAFPTIETPRADLLFVHGAAVLGLVYVPIVWALSPPAAEVASGAIPVALYAAVFLTYAWVFDGTHVFATWARLLSDAESWRRHRRSIGQSFLVLGAGPALVGGLALFDGAGVGPLLVLLALYQVWGFHHVNRQHWGLISLLRKRAGEGDPSSRRWDGAVFALVAWGPLIELATSGGLSALPGVAAPLGGPDAAGHGLVEIVVGLARWGPAFAFAGYLGLSFFAFDRPLNGSKFVLIGLIGGLHELVFSDLRLALCMTPIIGLGHAVEYHRIVWRDGRRHHRETDVATSWGRRFFGSPWAYGALLLLATGLFFRGPLSEYAFAGFAEPGGVRSLLSALGRPEDLSLLQRLLGALLIGVSAQHYFLDGRIWRLREDPTLTRRLLDGGTAEASR